MTVPGTKLSQIAPAGAPPALSDTLVGVSGGTTDNQFTLAQVQTTIGGTPSLPFNSIQINNAGSFGGDAAFAMPSIGTVTLGRGATATRGIFEFIAEDGTNVTIQPLPTTTNWTLSLPTNAGTPGFILKTDGSGVTSWVAPSGSPGGADTQVQFQHPGGAFAGDANFTWVAGAGLTIGGVVGVASGETYNITSTNTSFITPAYAGTGGNLFQGHAAVGNYADVDAYISAPGDPVNSAPQVGKIPLVVSDYFSGDLAAVVFADGIAIATGYKHTGNDPAFVFGMDFGPTNNSDSTGPYVLFQGLNLAPVNYGSGAIAFLAGAFAPCTHKGAGLVDEFVGLSAALAAYGPVTLAETFAAYPPGGTGPWASVYGINIYDHSGIGSTVSENIRSAGAGSINTFEGTITVQDRLVAALPTAGVKGRRSTVSDATQALTAGIGAIVAGTGGNTVPVFDDGTNWRIG